MPNFISNTIGLLIDNASPLPDATVDLSPVPGPISFAGTTQATAAPIVGVVLTVTNNTAANGGILPVGTAGQVIRIYPSLPTNAPKVYPPLGGTVGFLAVNTPIAITAQRGATFEALDTSGLNWGFMQG